MEDGEGAFRSRGGLSLMSLSPSAGRTGHVQTAEADPLGGSWPAGPPTASRAGKLWARENSNTMWYEKMGGICIPGGTGRGRLSGVEFRAEMVLHFSEVSK